MFLARFSDDFKRAQDVESNGNRTMKIGRYVGDIIPTPFCKRRFNISKQMSIQRPHTTSTFNLYVVSMPAQHSVMVDEIGWGAVFCKSVQESGIAIYLATKNRNQHT